MSEYDRLKAQRERIEFNGDLAKLRRAAAKAVEEFDALIPYARSAGYVQWSEACETLRDLKALLPAEPKEPTNG